VSTPGLSPLRQDAGGGQLGRDLAVPQTGLSADCDPLQYGLPLWGRDRSAALAGPAKRHPAGQFAVRPLVAENRRSLTSRQFPLEGASRLRPAGGLQGRQEALWAGGPSGLPPPLELDLMRVLATFNRRVEWYRHPPDSACPT
jgi:hypothetical protein